ncbi:hypothetical protein DH2020_040636 [Rehmannia glutinosa]|uniref:Uncharacterized protein n=1 Tax=Rehmannia glutinosa TaxID=99300 RepID=A0ABR0UUF7_REHGL
MVCFLVAHSLDVYEKDEKVLDVANDDEEPYYGISYWWGSTTENRKIHWASWRTLTTSKPLGGLGFKDLRIFNLAILGKQAWRLLTQPSSLLARVLQAKYYPGNSFMEAKLGHRPSWTWRSILEGRRILFVGCRKQIFSGRNTRIWGDRWIPKPPTFTPSLRHSTLPRDAPVSSLIIGNSDRYWNADLVRDTFTLDDARLILSLPLCAGNHNDRWVWHFTKNGKYSVKSRTIPLSPIRIASRKPRPHLL